MIPVLAQQWIVAIVVILLVAGLLKEISRPSMLFFVALLVLTTCGIVTPEEMLSGFSNSQIATVVLLLIIGNVINQTSLVPAIFDKLFKSSVSYRSFLSRLMLSVGGASAFMNNTPLVAMLIPYVYNWGKRHNVSPSKLLIPLSFATIAGGMISVIGTSTNLIVNGLLSDGGFRAFSLFEFAPIGIPVMIFVWLYMMFVGVKLLPDNKDPVQEVREQSKPFLSEIIILKNSPLIGMTVLEASETFLKGLSVLTQLEDKKHRLSVDAETKLHVGGHYIIKGSAEALAALLRSNAKVEVPRAKDFDPASEMDIVEVVVSYNSSLANKRVRDTKFKNIYGGFILAIHRQEGNIMDRVPEAVIHQGDVLMVLAKDDDLKKFKETTDFYVISKEPQEKKIGGWKSTAVGVSFLLVLLLNSLGLANLFTLSLWLGGFYVLLQVTNFRSVQRSMDIDLILVLALSIGLGKALNNTGLADTVAEAMITSFGQFGIIGALVGVYLMANVLTQLISNAASAAIVFPIAIATAQAFGADISTFAMTVAFAASLDFSTPIGYQTNLMVYGPGGYKFTDYMRVGIPLNLGLMVLVLTLICWIYGLV